MFNNIIGLDTVVNSLTCAIESKQLPASMLFSGSKFCGKLTVALELARILTCRQQGLWQCSCNDCQTQRKLTHPATIMLGTRYFTEEIDLCSRQLLENPEQLSLRYLFIRSVNKLLRRYQFIAVGLTQSQRDKVVKTQQELVTDCQQIALQSESQPGAANLKKVVEKIVRDCKKLLKTEPIKPATIDQIRELGAFSRSTGTNIKIIIIENADLLSVAVQNSLLKALEEPAKNCYYILLATNSDKLLPTIKSRLRHFHFPANSRERQLAVLEKIFRVKNINSETSLHSLFTNQDKIDSLLSENLAEKFLHFTLFEQNATAEIEEIIAKLNNKEDSLSFLNAFPVVLKRDIKSKKIDQRVGWLMLPMLNKISYSVEQLNQQPRALFEDFFFQLKELF